MKQILLFFAFFLPVCAFSQFYEPFEGPEVPPAWTGGREFFRIPSAGTLQFDGGRKSGTYSLGVPVAYTPTMEWEGKVSFGFNPSTANHARMYVYATGQAIFCCMCRSGTTRITYRFTGGREMPIRCG